MSENNIQIVRSFLKAMEALDTERMMDLLADDLVFITTGQHAGAGRKTKAEVAKELPAMREVLPGGLSFQEVSVTAQGNRVVMELKGSAKTADGRDYNNEYCHIYEIRDGKITLFRDYMDSALVEQILIPAFIAHGATAADRERERGNS